MLTVLPPVAYLLAAAFILWSAAERRPSGNGWMLPTVLGVLFLLLTLWTLANEGVLQFWTNHVANLAGNQVWLDLLIAVCIAFYLIAPPARAVGMRIIPWAIAVLATASLALLPMLARLLWLEQRRRT